MKIRKWFSFVTLKISFPIGITILVALLIFPLLLLTMEGLLRLIPIPESILVPSIDREINYPEIDIKFSRLAALERERKINCFLLGNSMIEVGLDPYFLNNQPNLLDVQNPSCFNMGLSNMMPETTVVIADILKKRSDPSLMILGISPMDFAGKESVTRDFIYSPWFQYQEGIFSPEGWWIENSETYRNWLAFQKYRNPVYRGELENLLLLIEPYGSQVRQKGRNNYQVQPLLHLPDFQISSKDLNGLIGIANLNTASLHVIVIEMPVHPDFLPYYIPGGEDGYEKQFIEPVQRVLKARGILFVRTQPQIKEIVTPDGWRDQFHLSKKGSEQLSQWLADKLSHSPGKE
jgi:hypothetical protein